MGDGPQLRTERLLLRRWTNADLAPFARMNRDPAVMEHFVKPLTRDESDVLVHRIEQHFTDHGYGLWAAEIPDVAPLIGFIGLAIPSFDAHFMPAVEIGWRLAHEHWGHGYATEGAQAVLDYAFNTAGLEALVSMCLPANRRSSQVMERIGMTRNPGDDFNHPAFPLDHRLSHHMLYRIDRDQWAAAAGSS